MTTQVLKVNSLESAFDLLQNAIDGQYDDGLFEVQFNNWPIFDVNFKGERYNSTLTAPIMKALIELQNNIYKAYADLVYGKSLRNLTAEERQSLEVVFRVKEGSSDVEPKLSDILTTMAAKAMDKMTGKQIIISIVGVAAIWGGVNLYSSHSANALDILKENNNQQTEQNRHELMLKLVSAQPKLVDASANHNDVKRTLLRSASDADSISVSGHSYSRTDLDEINKQDRQYGELNRIDGQYFISGLKNKLDSYRLELSRADDGKTVFADFNKGSLNMAEVQSIMDSFLGSSYIYLNIVARIKDDRITTANVVGVNNSAKGGEINHHLAYQASSLFSNDDSEEE